MEMIQCQARQGTNVRCHPVIEAWGKDAGNWCPGHLVKADEDADGGGNQGGGIGEKGRVGGLG